MKKQMSEWMNKPNKWIKYYYLNECVSKLCQSDKNNEWMGFSPPPPVEETDFQGLEEK